MSDACDLEIFCDESGTTGTKLLDPDQRYFSYASVAIDDGEAYGILAAAKKNHPVLAAQELKASTLLKTDNGRAMMSEVLHVVQGRFCFVLHDKVLALCGQLFEYVYEPVFHYFEPNASLPYRKNLHRFVAMYCYTFFTQRDDDGEEAVRQFEAFMRAFDPSVVPLLFQPTRLDGQDVDNPFGMVVKFAQGYRDIIIADNNDPAMPRGSRRKSLVDLASSGLWSLLNHWGAEDRPLRVTCDENKSLEVFAPTMTGGDDDPGIWRARAVMGTTERLGWRLAAPIRFEDSRNHPALQIADLIAGAVTTRMSRRGVPELDGIGALLDGHIHPHTILPDFDVPNIHNSEALVNWLMLYGLGERARRGEDAYALLPELYSEAERAYAAGEFSEIVSRA